MTTPDPNIFDFTSYTGPTLKLSGAFPADFDLSFLLPKVFLTDDFWADLLTSAATVLDSNVHTPLSNMVNIRVPEAQTRIYKALNANMMGFDIKDALLTDAGYDRLNRNAGGYLYTQGKDNFVCFLGYVLGIKLALVRLWTQDYVSFYPSAAGAPTVFEGGSWYPTTHVGLVYDTNDNVTATLPVTTDDLTELFYKYAPIDLVLKWVAANTTILLGTLYFSLLNMPSTNVRCDVDARGDFDVDVNLQTLSFSRGYTYDQTWCPRTVDHFYLSADMFEQSVDKFPVQSPLLFWNRTQGALPSASTDNANIISPVQANVTWVFTGVGVGTWLNAQTPRVNVNPVTGAPLGVLVELATQNYVRSSANIGASPWSIDGSPVSVSKVTDGMDSGEILQWTATTSGDALTSQASLQAGIYTAQVVYRKYVGGVANAGGDAPALQVLGAGSVMETGSTVPGEDLKVVYAVLSATAFGSPTSLGGPWKLATLTFTLTADALVQLVLPINGVAAFFYAGIEPGAQNTSFIPTGDCQVGVREADLIYLNMPQPELGTLAVGWNYSNFLGAANYYPQANATELLGYDSAGYARLSVNLGATVSAAVAIQLTTYVAVGGKYNPETLGYPFAGGVNPDATAPRVIVTWSTTGGIIDVNGMSNTYADSLNIGTVRLGPGWCGHLDMLTVSPSFTASATFALLQTTATDDV